MRVLRDPEIVALLAGAKVAIVEFAESPRLVVDWTADPLAAAAAYAAHRRAVGAPGPTNTPGSPGRSRWRSRCWTDAGARRSTSRATGPTTSTGWAALWSQRDLARRLRIEINGLAIPTPEEPEIDRYYAENVITGFLEISREHVDFERSLWLKMSLEIAGKAGGDPGG